jgi:hypothetical protein
MRDPFVLFWSTITLVAFAAAGWWQWRLLQESRPTVVTEVSIEQEEEATPAAQAVPK